MKRALALCMSLIVLVATPASAAGPTAPVEEGATGEVHASSGGQPKEEIVYAHLRGDGEVEGLNRRTEVAEHLLDLLRLRLHPDLFARRQEGCRRYHQMGLDFGLAPQELQGANAVDDTRGAGNADDQSVHGFLIVFQAVTDALSCAR